LFEPFDYTLVPLEDRAPNLSGIITPTSTTSPIEHARSIPTSHPSSADENLRVATPMGSRSRASTASPHGSPPLPTIHNFDLNFNNDVIPRSVPDEYHDYLKDAHTRAENVDPPTLPNPSKRRKGVTRNFSAGGGSQNILHGTGSWSELGEPPTTSGAMSSGDEREKRPSGMLGFLSRKKGRDRSPKAKERGVLGKEGARVVISNS